MKKIVLLSTLTTALLASFAAHAADTTELKVKGVIRPAACTPSFAGGNTVDYGTIPAKSLTAGAFTALDTREIALTVNCDSKVKIALKASDNRSASRVSGIVTSSTNGEVHNFGLGTVNGKNVGGYKIAFGANSDVDGVAQSGTLNRTDDKTGTWNFSSTASDTITHNGLIFTLGNSATPAEGKQWNFKLKVSPKLNKPENLDLTGDVPLDGSATLEVVYL